MGLSLQLSQCCFFRCFLLFVILCTSGCSTATTFRVLDAETRKPIEGAVALATWTMYRGMPGLAYSYTAKAIEAVSDQDGMFTIPGVTGKIAFNTPDFKVYKPGYVGWDSRLIYLGYRKNDIKRARLIRRENFTMKDQDILLEPWKDEYNHFTHYSFISPPTGFKKGGIKNSKYQNAIRYDVQQLRLERKSFQMQRR